jgi:choline-glycine betaine transporter
MKRKFYISAILVVMLVGFFSHLAIFYPSLSILAGKISPLPFGMLLLFLCPPFGRRRLGQVEAFTFFQWFSRILLSQLLMLILGATMLLAVFSAGPDVLNAKLAFQDLMQKVGEYSIWPWPGFPFVHIAIWGLSLAYFTYVKGRPPFHHNHANAMYKGRLGLFGKTYVEIVVQIPTQIALSLGFVSAILAMVLGLDWLLEWPIYAKVPAVIGIVMLLLMPLSVSAPAKRLVNSLARNHWDFSRVTLVLVLVLVPVLVGLGFVSEKLIHSSHFSTPIQTGHWLKFLPETANQDRLMFLYWGWWLAWMPLLGSYYAAISEGRRIRTFIIGILVMPILFFVFLKTSGAQIFNWQIWENNRGEFALLLGLLSAGILFIITHGRQDTSLFARGFMPAPDFATAGRSNLSHGTKIFGLSRFIASFIVGIVAFIFLLNAGGWYFVGLLLAVFSPCLIYKTCGISLSFFNQLLKDVKGRHE